MAGTSSKSSSFEKLIMALDVLPTDKVVLVKEFESADSNFILTHLLTKLLDNENNRVCFVIAHNTIGHYHNVVKKLGSELLGKIDTGQVKLLDILSAVFKELVFCTPKFTDSKNENVVKYLYRQIASDIETLNDGANNKEVFIVIDDLSKILDIGVEIPLANTFLGYLLTLTKQDNVHLMVNMHIGDNRDEFLAKSIQYAADINIEVHPLKTGYSSDVTGIIKIRRNEESSPENTYHYKSSHKDVNLFRPGKIFTN